MINLSNYEESYRDKLAEDMKAGSAMLVLKDSLMADLLIIHNIADKMIKKGLCSDTLNELWNSENYSIKVNLLRKFYTENGIKEPTRDEAIIILASKFLQQCIDGTHDPYDVQGVIQNELYAEGLFFDRMDSEPYIADLVKIIELNLNEHSDGKFKELAANWIKTYDKY